eukprot:393154-Prymnesium_polylepis.2
MAASAAGLARTGAATTAVAARSFGAAAALRERHHGRHGPRGMLSVVHQQGGGQLLAVQVPRVLVLPRADAAAAVAIANAATRASAATSVAGVPAA